MFTALFCEPVFLEGTGGLLGDGGLDQSPFEGWVEVIFPESGAVLKTEAFPQGGRRHFARGKGEHDPINWVGDWVGNWWPAGGHRLSNGGDKAVCQGKFGFGEAGGDTFPDHVAGVDVAAGGPCHFFGKNCRITLNPRG